MEGRNEDGTPVWKKQRVEQSSTPSVTPGHHWPQDHRDRDRGRQWQERRDREHHDRVAAARTRSRSRDATTTAAVATTHAAARAAAATMTAGGATRTTAAATAAARSAATRATETEAARVAASRRKSGGFMSAMPSQQTIRAFGGRQPATAIMRIPFIDLKPLKRATQVDEVRRIVDDIVARGGMQKSGVATPVLQKLGQVGLWKEALARFGDINRPNIVNFGAAISACEKGGQWEEALKLLEEAQTRGVEPNVKTFSAVISACEKGRPRASLTTVAYPSGCPRRRPPAPPRFELTSEAP